MHSGHLLIKFHFDDYDDFNIVLTITLSLGYFQREFDNFNSFRLKLSIFDIFNILKETVTNNLSQIKCNDNNFNSFMLKLLYFQYL